MNRRRRWAGGLAAVTMVLVFGGAVAAADEAPRKKGFFNRLRGGGTTDTVPAPTASAPAPASSVVPAPASSVPAPSSSAPLPAAAAAAPAAVEVPYDVKGLLDPIDRIRRSVLATDPSVVAYLDRIEGGTASAAQLNDFASYLLRHGVPAVAVDFQRAATEVAPDRPSLWVNLGTIEQARGKGGNAKSAYKRAIELDPTNAMAYYGLGVVADADRDYDDAIEYYRRALLIDPTLADPKVNPQVVNNERMLAVKLLLSKERAGAMALPLLPSTQDK